MVWARGGPPKSPQCWGDFKRVVDAKVCGWGGVGPLNPPYMGDFNRVVLGVGVVMGKSPFSGWLGTERAPLPRRSVTGPYQAGGDGGAGAGPAQGVQLNAPTGTDPSRGANRATFVETWRFGCEWAWVVDRGAFLGLVVFLMGLGI